MWDHGGCCLIDETVSDVTQEEIMFTSGAEIRATGGKTQDEEKDFSGFEHFWEQLVQLNKIYNACLVVFRHLYAEMLHIMPLIKPDKTGKHKVSSQQHRLTERNSSRLTNEQILHAASL